MTVRAFYSNKISEFVKTETDVVLAEIVKRNPFELNDLQRDAWIAEIGILKRELIGLQDGSIFLEFTIPRMGKRVDAIVLYNGIIFLLEFKVGESEYRTSALKQVMDYALDLKNFHRGSWEKTIVPLIIPTEAPDCSMILQKYNDNICNAVGVSQHQVGSTIAHIGDIWPSSPIDYNLWATSEYMPTPTIIEAAQALYNNHSVEEITRSDAGARNLTLTTQAIKRIICNSKKEKRKSIIFVTGVPGAGKTLVGLNLASEFHDNIIAEHAVFLSGNLPLVAVLQEALARDKIEREREHGKSISKDDALREVKGFIQIIHHYRDEYVGNNRVPAEHIAIFDESQRAWTRKEISSFMARKKGIKNFDYSEPEFLISTMNRRPDWAAIVCLVGGGQEINRGEAGLPEWFDSLRRSFFDWDIYAAPMVDDTEYLRGQSWQSLIQGINVKIVNDLHLSSSMRSFRSEKVSLLIKQMLSSEPDAARQTFAEVKGRYPIYITRDLEKAKLWVKNQARGSERYGLLASSTAARLKPRGIYYAKDRSSLSPEKWFLNPEDDIRSSCFLETVASEFETQGLELDYAIVAWDADLRIEDGKWKYYQMNNRCSPPNWSQIKSEDTILYLTNAYRVLLTRARQGFIIYVPEGVTDDVTRKPECYDPTFNYLKALGIPEI